MKKSQVARGIIGSVASLLGVVAIGCSADVMDEGAAGNGEIGSVAQALSVSATNTLADANLQASFAAHCKLVDGATEYVIIAGGFVGASPQTAIQKFDGTTWTTLGVSLANARGHAVALPVPGAPNSCIIAGGTSQFAPGGAARTDVQVLTIASGVESITPLAGAGSVAQLPEARSHFELAACDGKVMAVGGQHNSALETKIRTWDPSSPGTAWANPASLSQGRADFALVKDFSTTRFVAAGGDDLNGNPLSDIDLISTSNSCANMTVANPTTFTSLSYAAVGLKGLSVANNAIRVFGGGSFSGAFTNENVLTVNAGWTDVTARATANPVTAVRYPKLVDMGSSVFLLVAGDNGDESGANTLATPSTLTVQKFSAGAWQTPIDLESTQGMTTTDQSRVGAVLEKLGSNAVLAVGQNIAAGTRADLDTAIQIVP